MNPSCNLGVSWWRQPLFAPNRISRVEGTHVSLERKPCMLEIAASSALFPCENGDGFRMRYFLVSGIFKEEIGSLCSK
jgi:hypothetical protein